jgi:actin-related protein
VERWSDVEGLWNYVFSSLMCIQDNPDFPVLISQPGLNPRKNAEKIAEVCSISAGRNFFNATQCDDEECKMM